MKDLLPLVAEKLSPIAQVELSYNGINAELPLIILSETDNMAAIIADNSEWASSITIQVDCYHHGEKAVKDVALKASEILTSCGFRRTIGQLLKEDNLDRYTMQFNCVVDAVNRIYCGNNMI